MKRCKNIAITGARQAGKTTLADGLLEKLDLPYAGFRTTVYARTALGPLYQLTDVMTGESVHISHLTDAGIRGIPSAFEEQGLRCLRNALAAPAPMVLLDEIGRFERGSPTFLQAVTDLLDSSKHVIAVLKKEDLAHIKAIRARADMLLVDLDVCGRAAAWAISDQWRLSL